MNSLRSPLLVAILAGIFISSSFILAQGSLTPPGAPAPTMKTLDQLEPRKPNSALPFTISNPGSYYVTGNLTGVAAQHGITINADNVTLDLGGFELVGPGSGITAGIRLINSHVNATIRNGTLRGWLSSTVVAETAVCTEMHVENVRVFNGGGGGIFLGNNGTAKGCEVRGCAAAGITGGTSCKIIGCTVVGETGGVGISLSTDSIVRDCVVTGCVAGSNGVHGFTVGDACSVQNCAAFSNTGNGCVLSNGVTLLNCTAENNTGTSGISALGACSLIGCVVRGSTSASAISAGITTGTECLVSQCVVSNVDSTAAFTPTTGMGVNVGGSSTVERCTVQGSRGDGVRAISSCLILNNTCDRNGSGTGDGAGIHTTSTENRIEGNTVTGTDRRIDVTSTGSLIIKNTAATNTTTTDYEIAASNRYGAIINITAAGAAAVSGNTAASTLASTDPWANFSY